MKNEEFLRILERTEQNLFMMTEEFQWNTEGKNSHRAISKIIGEIDLFHLETKNDIWDIYYDNSILGIIDIYRENDQRLVIPLMILYTNIFYYIRKAKQFVSKSTYERLSAEKKKLGKAIRKACCFDFEDVVFTKEKYEKIKSFIEFSISRLYHCIEDIGECSTIVVEKDAKKLKRIRNIYQSFQIEDQSIIFYDEILRKRVKISMNSSQGAYAITMLFCRAYVETVPWLKKNYPNGQWCPVVPWDVLQRFRMLLEKMYYE